VLAAWCAQSRHCISLFCHASSVWLTLRMFGSKQVADVRLISAQCLLSLHPHVSDEQQLVEPVGGPSVVGMCFNCLCVCVPVDVQ